MTPWLRVLRVWLPLGIAVTLLMGITYLELQQSYRLNANDPQIQMAEDAAARIESGVSPQDALESTAPVDILASLAPFVNITDSTGAPVFGNGFLRGDLRVPPNGAITASLESGRNEVTWQPEIHARIASVIVPIGDGTRGYVVAGRSLREVEAREGLLTQRVGLTWIVTMAITLVTVMVIEMVASKMREKRPRT